MEEFGRADAVSLKTFVTKVLETVGAFVADAVTTADVLVKADLRGVDSHGVARLNNYVDSLSNGQAKASPGRRSARGEGTRACHGAAGVERGVVAGHELRGQEVGADIGLELLFEPVGHGFQMAVEGQVDVALVGLEDRWPR